MNDDPTPTLTSIGRCFVGTLEFRNTYGAIKQILQRTTLQASYRHAAQHKCCAQALSPLWVNRVVLAPCLELPVHPQGTDIAPIPRIVRRAVHGVTLDDRDIGPSLRWAQRKSARSRAVVYSPAPACDGLRFHSATAKQYCSSSSFVARRSRLPAHGVHQPEAGRALTAALIETHVGPAVPRLPDGIAARMSAD
jgi:hypothetical protein